MRSTKESHERHQIREENEGKGVTRRSWDLLVDQASDTMNLCPRAERDRGKNVSITDVMLKGKTTESRLKRAALRIGTTVHYRTSAGARSSNKAKV